MKTKPSYQITIPEPCSEDWDAMQPNGCGRFCGSCEKTVVDFTVMTDDEIIKTLQQQGSLCGRFFKDQVGRELVPSPAYRNSFPTRLVQKIAASLLLVHTLVFDSAGQQKKQPLHTNNTGTKKPQQPGTVQVVGKVRDLETQKPLANVKIEIRNGNGYTIVTDTTDKLGHFNFIIPKEHYGTEAVIITTWLKNGEEMAGNYIPEEKIYLVNSTANNQLVLYSQQPYNLDTITITHQPDHFMGLIDNFENVKPAVPAINDQLPARPDNFWKRIAHPFKKK